MSAPAPTPTDVSTPEVPASATTVDAPSHPPFRKAPWTAAILLAGVVAWLGYSFPPMHWRTPDSLMHIGALSPASEQAKLKAVEEANLWNNTLLKFVMAGLGFGLVGLVLNAQNIGRRWPVALATLISGAISGALAGALGLLLRQYFDHEHPLPLVSTEMRPLLADGVVFSLISVLLLIPVSVLLLFQPLKSDRHKAFAVPLAGILSGILIPVGSALLSALVLSGYTNTSSFPPSGIDLTLLWFAGMSILTALLVAYHGHKPDKAPAAAA